jgi:hypothetical protein
MRHVPSRTGLTTHWRQPTTAPRSADETQTTAPPEHAVPPVEMATTSPLVATTVTPAVAQSHDCSAVHATPTIAVNERPPKKNGLRPIMDNANMVLSPCPASERCGNCRTRSRSAVWATTRADCGQRSPPESRRHRAPAARRTHVADSRKRAYRRRSRRLVSPGCRVPSQCSTSRRSRGHPTGLSGNGAL